MSLKALAIQHLQSNQQRNQHATLSCAGTQLERNFTAGCATMDSAAIVQNFLAEADRLFRSCRPSAEQHTVCMKHFKNADLLLFLGNTMQAIGELDKALQALQPRSATQEGLFHEAA